MSRLLQRARLTSVPCDWTGASPLFTRAPFISCQSVASAADWFQPLATPGPQASMAADRRSEAKARSRALATTCLGVGWATVDIGILEHGPSGGAGSTPYRRPLRRNSGQMVRSWAPRRDLGGSGPLGQATRHGSCVCHRAGREEGDVTRQHAILVVDDDRDVRELWTETLRDLGHHVEEAVDGLHALRLLHDGRLPCVVLSDVRMPRLDGWELAQAVSRD